ncbi:MAG: exodeoxyribonuclease I [Spirochaetales bacterium]|nr:exodeoxyribonuclease I [Spirochaetales bacterium]
MSNTTIFWYDLETFGKDPLFDRVAQFAGVRTDLELNIIGDPLVLYCKISPDYIPDPLACFITGITPQETLEKGLNEYDFIKRINDEFSVPDTTVAGYNNIKFDDEFIRNLLFRNFFDPYRREYENNNARWDLLDLVRATHDLRPDGINWYYNEAGAPSFKLDKLSILNGIEHDNAHDALADVYATIEIARLIKQTNENLFNYHFSNRYKSNVKQKIDFYNKVPFFYTSSFLSNGKGCSSILVPLTTDQVNKNNIICFDLSNDPQPIIDNSVADLKRMVFSSESDLKALKLERVRFQTVSINKAPFIGPANILKDEEAARIGLNLPLCREHYKKIKNNKDLIFKVTSVFSNDKGAGAPLAEDPDFSIYSGGFITDSDRQRLEFIHQNIEEPEKILTTSIKYDDSRLYEMQWRFVCRNFPHVLSGDEAYRWRSFCASRVLMPPKDRTVDFHFYMRKLDEYQNDKEASPEKLEIIRKLKLYGKKIQDEVLTFGQGELFE